MVYSLWFMGYGLWFMFMVYGLIHAYVNRHNNDVFVF